MDYTTLISVIGAYLSGTIAQLSSKALETAVTEKMKQFLTSPKAQEVVKNADQAEAQALVESEYKKNPSIQKDFEAFAEYLQKEYPKETQIICKTYIAHQEFNNSTINF